MADKIDLIIGITTMKTSKHIIICIENTNKISTNTDSYMKYYLSTSLSKAIRKYKTIADGKLITLSSRQPLQLYIWIGIEYPKNIKYYDSIIWRKYFVLIAMQFYRRKTFLYLMFLLKRGGSYWTSGHVLTLHLFLFAATLEFGTLG